MPDSAQGRLMHQRPGLAFVLMLTLFSLTSLIPFGTVSLSFISILLYDILTYSCPFYLSVLAPYLTHLYFLFFCVRSRSPFF